MNEQKFRKLFDAARNEQPPAVTDDLQSRVLRTIRAERKSPTETISLSQALGALFPKLAFISALIIIACVVGDYLLSPDSLGLQGDVAKMSEQWPFVGEGF